MRLCIGSNAGAMARYWGLLTVDASGRTPATPATQLPVSPPVGVYLNPEASRTTGSSKLWLAGGGAGGKADIKDA